MPHEAGRAGGQRRWLGGDAPMPHEAGRAGGQRRWLGGDAPMPHEQGAWVLLFVSDGAVEGTDGGKPTSRGLPPAAVFGGRRGGGGWKRWSCACGGGGGRVTGRNCARGATLPCPAGQGALRGCGGDAVCPGGAKALLCGAPDFGGFTGKSMLWGSLPFRKGWQARREDGGRGSAVGKGWIYTSYAGHAVLWVKTRPFPASPLAAKTVLQPRPLPLHLPPSIPRGERRALPAPAQGTRPLGIPF